MFVTSKLILILFKLIVVENKNKPDSEKRTTSDINNDESEICEDNSDYNPEKDSYSYTSDSHGSDCEELRDNIENKDPSDERRNGELIIDLFTIID